MVSMVVGICERRSIYSEAEASIIGLIHMSCVFSWVQCEHADSIMSKSSRRTQKLLLVTNDLGGKN